MHMALSVHSSIRASDKQKQTNVIHKKPGGGAHCSYAPAQARGRARRFMHSISFVVAVVNDAAGFQE